MTTTTTELDAQIAAAEEALKQLRVSRSWAAREERERAAAEREYNTDRARWKRATKTIRQSGVRFRSNVSKCCRGCVVNEDLGLPADAKDPKVAWTFGGQGARIGWNEYDGRAYFPNDVHHSGRVAAYINHEGGVGQVVADAFRAEGFEVEWDGTDAQCVIVKFGKEDR